MKNINRIGTLTFALLALSSASVSAETGPGTTQNDNTKPNEGCTNLGTGEQIPGSVTEGPPICGADLDLTIEVPGGSGTVTVGTHGCPAFIEIIPAYTPAVHKMGYRITDEQKVYHMRATYYCWGWIWDSCYLNDDGWEQTENYKLTYQDMPCDVIVPQNDPTPKPQETDAPVN